MRNKNYKFSKIIPSNIITSTGETIFKNYLLSKYPFVCSIDCINIADLCDCVKLLGNLHEISPVLYSQYCLRCNDLWSWYLVVASESVFKNQADAVLFRMSAG